MSTTSPQPLPADLIKELENKLEDWLADNNNFSVEENINGGLASVVNTTALAKFIAQELANQREKIIENVRDLLDEFNEMDTNAMQFELRIRKPIEFTKRLDSLKQANPSLEHCSGCTDPDPLGATHQANTIEHPAMGESGLPSLEESNDSHAVNQIRRDTIEEVIEALTQAKKTGASSTLGMAIQIVESLIVPKDGTAEEEHE